MKGSTSVRLLINDKNNHGSEIKQLLEESDYFDCLVAFAKSSAFHQLLIPLQKSLSRGMKARLAIGLDFHQTEPDLLRKFLQLANDPSYDIKLFVSNSNNTFHPKIYAFRHGSTSSVIIGSANFTQGGLTSNHEASAVIEEKDSTMMSTITKYFDDIISNKIIVPATKSLIDNYEKEYLIFKTYQNLAIRNANLASKVDETDAVLLRDILISMKQDDSTSGFEEQIKKRKRNLLQARKKLILLSSLHLNSIKNFSSHYEDLINTFHSGGLHRGKGIVSQYPKQFIKAVKQVLNTTPNLPPGEIYSILHSDFSDIQRAGINLLSEILHTLNNKRYAVMNQNAVSGLRLAGFRDYPLHPSKKNVNADIYSRFCHDAITVQKKLGLANLTELDALFNYAYWRPSTYEDESEN
jgi:HKD family nuclease